MPKVPFGILYQINFWQPPDGYAFLYDLEGNLIVDENGNYIIGLL